MAELVADCPRCGAQKITFDVNSAITTKEEQYGWQQWYEVFSICRMCQKSTVFVVKESAHGNYIHVHKVGLLNVAGALNRYVDIDSYISQSHQVCVVSPKYLPQNIDAIFREATMCASVSCFNAAGTMARLCVDMATKSLLPEGDFSGLNSKIRRDLGLRLPWLIENGQLPKELKGLSSCIKEDGNDGAHAGTLGSADAEDLIDFTVALLERLYTEPERLRLAEERRKARRVQ